jgi:hypothetical protein
MKLISARSQIRELVSMFETCMANPHWGTAKWTKDQQREILRKLKSLDLETATVEEVNTITEIPYVEMHRCDECEQDFWDVVELGENLDDHSGTSYICRSCLKTALTMFTTST